MVGIMERSVTLKCMLKYLAGSIFWLKNGQSLPKNIILVKTSIKILKLSREDEGIYTCKGTKLMDLYSYSYSLKVAGQ